LIARLWSRARGFFARVFRRKPAEPGRFVADSRMSWRGWLAVMPWLWPSREYLVYVPRGYGGWRRRPLLVLLQFDAAVVDQLLRGLVVGGQLDLDPLHTVGGVDLDLAGVQLDLQLDRACYVERLLHRHLPSSGRSRTGACR